MPLMTLGQEKGGLNLQLHSLNVAEFFRAIVGHGKAEKHANVNAVGL